MGRKKIQWSENDLAAVGRHVAQREMASQSITPPAKALAGALSALGLTARLDAGKRRSSPSAIALPQNDQHTDSKKKNKKKSMPTTEPLRQTVDDSGREKATETPAKPRAKKRQGVSTAPIYKSLEVAAPQAQWGADWLAIDIPGGRVLTYNELFSILQFRKYEAFRYKKVCRMVIARALNVPSATPKPFFDGPTRLTLVRVGAKEMDRDALPIVFKYFLDTLKHEGVIDDDNPNIIVDIVTHQGTGTPRLAMRLDKVPAWSAPSVPDWKDLIQPRYDHGQKTAAKRPKPNTSKRNT